MRWEYLILDLTSLAPRDSHPDALNRAGANGWELIAVVPPLRAFFKRPLDGSPKPARARSK